MPSYLPLLVFVLGALLHSLSDDGGASILAHFGITWRVPTSALPVAILGFGIVDGAVDRFSQGATWAAAIEGALMVSLATVFGATTQHAMVNRSLPQFAKADVPKGFLMLIGAGLVAVSVSACSLFTPANLPKTEETAKDIACILEHAFLDDPSLNTVCNLLTPAQQALGHTTAAEHRAGVAKAMASLKAERCSDAGAEGGK